MTENQSAGEAGAMAGANLLSVLTTGVPIDPQSLIVPEGLSAREQELLGILMPRLYQPYIQVEYNKVADKYRFTFSDEPIKTVEEQTPCVETLHDETGKMVAFEVRGIGSTCRTELPNLVLRPRNIRLSDALALMERIHGPYFFENGGRTGAEGNRAWLFTQAEQYDIHIDLDW